MKIIMKKSYYQPIALLMILSISIISCKDNPSAPEQVELKITSVSPQSGVPGDEVTISGLGFEEETLSVLFGGVEAKVINYSDTEIIAEVPKDAVTGSIQIVMGIQVAEGPEFSVLTTGALEVVISTSGDDQDRDGYILQIDRDITLDSQINDTLYFDNIVEGNHSLKLNERDNLCKLKNGDTQEVSITAQETTSIVMEVTCEDVIIDNSIIYESTNKIFATHQNGSIDTRFVNGIGGQEPVLSHDGKKVAFHQFIYGGNDIHIEIFIADVSGYPITRITHTEVGTVNTRPSWSPDDSQLAFTRDSEIYVVNADGSGLTRLTNNSYLDRKPVWSPDGSKIAYVSANRPDVNGAEIFLMNPDGSNKVQLTNNSQSKHDFSWSPDGNFIAFVDQVDNTNKIFIMNADGTNIRQLVKDDLDDGQQVSWSPDGGQLTFGRWDDIQSDVFKVNFDGSGLVNITNTNHQDEYNPYWSKVQ